MNIIFLDTAIHALNCAISNERKLKEKILKNEESLERNCAVEIIDESIAHKQQVRDYFARYMEIEKEAEEIIKNS